MVAKTGTYGDYGASALAGALRGPRGLVYFAILNHGVPIEAARRRQDAFVRALLASLDDRALGLPARRSARLHARRDPQRARGAGAAPAGAKHTTLIASAGWRGSRLR